MAIARSFLTGRAFPALASAAAAGAAAVVWVVDRSAGLRSQMWGRVGVPALLPTFADLRAYTAARDCV